MKMSKGKGLLQWSSTGGLSGTSKIGQKLFAAARTGKLQIASGGQYKFLLVSRIVSFLKTEFLDSKEPRLTVNQLLTKIKENGVSEELKEWLEYEGLPNHPRTRLVELRNNPTLRFQYNPPLKNCESEEELLALLKDRHAYGTGGLLRSLVEDSFPGAEGAARAISNLQKAGKITIVQRLDKNQTLFYKAPEPEMDKLVCDKLFIDLWRRVDVSNKEMTHINAFLKNKGFSVLNDKLVARKKKIQEAKAAAAKRTETVPPNQISQRGGRALRATKRAANAPPKPRRRAKAAKKTEIAPPEKPKRKNVVLKTNAHLASELFDYDISISSDDDEV